MIKQCVGVCVCIGNVFYSIMTNGRTKNFPCFVLLTFRKKTSFVLKQANAGKTKILHFHNLSFLECCKYKLFDQRDENKEEKNETKIRMSKQNYLIKMSQLAQVIIFYHYDRILTAWNESFSKNSIEKKMNNWNHLSNAQRLKNYYFFVCFLNSEVSLNIMAYDENAKSN